MILSNSILISIKPVFVEKIFSGEKKFEFRKSIYKSQSVNTAFIYCSAPTSSIVGEFSIDDTIYLPISALWNQTKSYAGINQSDFLEYFNKKNYGYALVISGNIKYTQAIPLREIGLKRPPQSFCYINSEQALIIRNTKSIK